jgi:mRNA interferase RelE/StbE
MYRVLLERGAEKDRARLSSGIHARAIAAIQALANNPRPPGCRKLAGSKNDWRIRVGDYRVLWKMPRRRRRPVFRVYEIAKAALVR